MVKKRKKPPQEEGPPDVSRQELTQVLEAKSTKAVDKSVNVAKLTLELLETTTTQLVRRMGWFRDVRLRRLADSFMRSSKMHQQASSRENWETERGMAKPSPRELGEYEEALKQHILQAQTKFKAVPMNGRREINVKGAGPGKVVATKLHGLKARAKELERRPKSVIKGLVMAKKRKNLAKESAKPKGKGDEDEDL